MDYNYLFNNITLYPWQNEAITFVLEAEDTWKTKQQYTNCRLLTNEPGTGKSYVILGLISITKSVPKKKIKIYDSFQIISRTQLLKYNRASLIVCSPSIIGQWNDYCENVKDLKWLIISKPSDLKKNIDNNYDLIICNSIRYNEFVSNHDNIIWNRFIYDDADSCHIPAMEMIFANFFWIITATPQALHAKYRGNLYKTHFCGHLISQWKTYNMFKTIEINTIENPLNFKLNKHVCKYKSIKILDKFKSCFSSELQKVIDTQDFVTAICMLGGDINKEIDLKTLLLRHFNQRLEHYTKLQNQTQMDAIQASIDSIDEIFKEKIENECGICIEQLQSPMILLKCCFNMVCSKCLFKLKNQNTNCPYCRSKLNNYVGLVKDTESVSPSSLPTPLPTQTQCQILINLIKDSTKKKIIIVAFCDDAFKMIQEISRDLNTSINILNGSSNTRSAKIKLYKNAERSIICLNSDFNAAGINLENTTDIIFYHEIKCNQEKQIIGRALRVNRDPNLVLNVYYFKPEE